jgi:hypothetical protein
MTEAESYLCAKQLFFRERTVRPRTVGVKIRNAEIKMIPLLNNAVLSAHV